MTEARPGAAKRRVETIRRIQQQHQQELQQIKPIQPTVRPRVRKACERNFERFCLKYFPSAFPLKFSDDHRKVIAKIQTSVLSGGLFAVAMPRGSGKTTLCEIACIWALLYGHRRFVLFIGSDLGASARSLQTIKTELECNDLLFEDFHDVCGPIRDLERIANRAKGQKNPDGTPTYIHWAADVITLPNVTGVKWARAGCSVVRVAGLTGSIRGLKQSTPLGQSIRPDLVVIDDPQTDESARSLSQCAYRERVLSGAVLGLAGPGKQISGIMPCTVIAPGDLADRMLDSAKHPEWNGERCKLLYSLPERMDLWEEYARVRAESFRQGKAGRCATEYYQAHRAEMDRGALCAWPERKRPDEASALQHAMNLRIDDPAAFASEYQNEPLVEDADGDRKTLTADQICEQLSRIPRGTAPGSARHVTAFIDVQGDLLYWMAAAWAEDFTGSIIDYGTWPDQRRPYFTLRDARPTIPQATGITSLEGSLFAALEQLSRVLLGKEYPLDQGGVTRVSRCLVDANWGMSTDLVYRWCRQTPFAGLVTPSHGKAIGASSLPMDEWARRPGSRYGLGWVMPTPKPGRVPHCVYDSNYWKSFVHGRLAAPAGELGGLTLHGDKSQTHRLIAEHLTSEFPVEVTGRGRTCFEWKWRPNRPDNHWLDCLVGCAVAASLCGVKLQIPGAPPPRRRNWAEEQRAAMAARGRR